VFCRQVGDLEALYREHHDKAEFLLVMVRDVGHALAGLEFLVENASADPESRRPLIARAMQIKKVTIPAALDTRDARAQMTYAGWPMRLVVVGLTGRLEFDARFEPSRGLDIARLAQWLKRT
jgi:hypothetical protein